MSVLQMLGDKNIIFDVQAEVQREKLERLEGLIETYYPVHRERLENGESVIINTVEIIRSIDPESEELKPPQTSENPQSGPAKND